jgi:hypothetical protein
MSKYFQQGTREYDFTNTDVVAVSGTSAQSTAFISSEIAIAANTNCWITIGANPTAVADTDANMYLPAGVVFHLRVKVGDKLAAIQDTAAGHISVTPC